jgi:hypothetical protein
LNFKWKSPGRFFSRLNELAPSIDRISGKADLARATGFVVDAKSSNPSRGPPTSTSNKAFLGCRKGYLKPRITLMATD